MTPQPVTFVNVLTVEPERQQELVDLLVEGLDEVIRHRPGFVRASVLASLDGGAVINLAQWRSPADAAATQREPDAAAYAQRVAAIARPQPGLYRVVAEVD